MNPTCLPRINKELADFKKTSQTAHFEVRVVEKNIMHWKGWMPGPKDTVYQGGLYQLDIVFPNQYPYKPPKMKFDTKIWHPNISSQTGAICLDILKDQWSPALSIRTAMLSLQAMMCAPQPDSPQDAVVANQYTSNIKEFNETARQWVQLYASPQSRQQKVKRLMEMGFKRQLVVEILQKNCFDEQKALEEIISKM